jgi:hypothetical protein
MDRYKILKKPEGEKPCYAPVGKKEIKRHNQSFGPGVVNVHASEIQALVGSAGNAGWSTIRLMDIPDSTAYEYRQLGISPEEARDFRMMHGIDLRNHG